MDTVHVQDNLVISGSNDKTVQVWNMDIHRQLWEFDHEDRVSCLIVRENWVITCCGKSVRVLALESGAVLHCLDHPSSCSNADINPNKSILAVACYSSVVLWDMKKQVKMKEFDLAPDIRALQFNPSGDKIIVGAYEGEVFKIEMK